MNKLNILVVEDKPANIAAAHRFLAEHNLTVVSGFDDALTALKRNGHKRREVEAPEKFDVVLTDCMFPKGGTACMGPKGEAVVNCQGEMPYGPMVLLHALEVGVQNIGMITQGNHHDDPFVFALDNLRGFRSEKVSVVITNSLDHLVYAATGEAVDPKSDDFANHWKRQEEGKVLWVKDWKRLLDRMVGVEVVEDEYQKSRLARRQI